MFYPDGDNLIVVDVDNKVALVRPNQFIFLREDYSYRPWLEFQDAPLVGTCQVALPSMSEEKHLYDILARSLRKALKPA